jgi:hypothetical protein
MSTQTNGRNPVRQAYGSYQLPIERRAVIAAGMVRENGWTRRQAAGHFCVNPAYVGLVARLGEDERLKLVRGELTLSALYHGDRQRLAPERRAKRLAAKREEQTRRINRVLDRVGLDRVMQQIVCRFGFRSPLEELDTIARRTGRDIIEIVIDDDVGAGWAARVLDRLTAPQRVAAE